MVDRLRAGGETMLYYQWARTPRRGTPLRNRYVERHSSMSGDLGLEAEREPRFAFADGQTAWVVTDPKEPSEEPQSFHAGLLDLSSHGTRLSVPTKVAIDEALRLRVSVAELGLEFYLSASVCWSKPDGHDGWQVGCVLEPGIPAGILDKLSAGGRLDRRNAGRYEDTPQLRARRVLDSGDEFVILRDYSQGGFCVSASQTGTPGDPIQICLEEPEERVIVATIRWQLRVEDGYLLGCAFLGDRDVGYKDVGSTQIVSS